jgi:sigma-B regulation protein RsbU (phosphoserine phosphatase)
MMKATREAGMASLHETFFLPQLEQRREQLLKLDPGQQAASELTRLLGEVDAAIARLRAGSFGLCETCHGGIEADRLLADPLARFCLDHLSQQEQRALERDLELAACIQRGFLPPAELAVGGWQICTHYEPASVVSGDFCDVCRPDPSGDGTYLMFGDVAGKGVAAAMLMSHLHATFRTLVTGAQPVAELVGRANRVFKESTLQPRFATLICARLDDDGSVELCNAGHWPPLILRGGTIERIEPTGLPVGTFLSSSFGSLQLRLDVGDSLVLYTDGLIEARDTTDREYSSERLETLLAGCGRQDAGVVLATVLADLARHLGVAMHTDDLSVVVVHRER